MRGRIVTSPVPRDDTPIGSADPGPAAIRPGIGIDLEAQTQAVTAELRSRLEERLAHIPLAVDTPELIESFVSGKLLRARALILVGHAFGQPDHDFSIASASALELLHTASLLHDDIIDGSVLRRGRPTLHIAADEATAILIADLLIALAFEIAAPFGAAATSPLATAFARLCEGQLLESSLTWDSEALPGIERYAECKTGALFGAAFELAATASSLPHEQRGMFGAAGRKIGVAFQFQDDLLDIRTDALNLGKDHGADLRNGIPTLPLWAAYRSGSIDVSSPPLSAERLLETAGSPRVLALTVDRISILVEESRAALPAADRPELFEAAMRMILADIDRFRSPIPQNEVP